MAQLSFRGATREHFYCSREYSAGPDVVPKLERGHPLRAMLNAGVLKGTFQSFFVKSFIGR